MPNYLETLQELLGGMTSILGEGHNELGSLDIINLVILNELHDGNQTWVGSTNAHGIEHKVLGDSLLFVIVTVPKSTQD